MQEKSIRQIYFQAVLKIFVKLKVLFFAFICEKILQSHLLLQKVF